MVHQDATTNVLLLMAIVKTFIAILGTVITYIALKAYRRTGERSLGYLTAGFGLVTLGAILGGLVFELVAVELAVGILIEAIFVAAGFVLIAHSLRIP